MGVTKFRSSDAPEDLRWQGFHPTPAISAATLKKSQLEGVGSNPCHLMKEIGSCLMGKLESRH